MNKQEYCTCTNCFKRKPKSSFKDKILVTECEECVNHFTTVMSKQSLDARKSQARKDIGYRTVKVTTPSPNSKYYVRKTSYIAEQAVTKEQANFVRTFFKDNYGVLFHNKNDSFETINDAFETRFDMSISHRIQSNILKGLVRRGRRKHG